MSEGRSHGPGPPRSTSAPGPTCFAQEGAHAPSCQTTSKTSQMRSAAQVVSREDHALWEQPRPSLMALLPPAHDATLHLRNLTIPDARMMARGALSSDLPAELKSIRLAVNARRHGIRPIALLGGRLGRFAFSPSERTMNSPAPLGATRASYWYKPSNRILAETHSNTNLADYISLRTRSSSAQGVASLIAATSCQGISQRVACFLLLYVDPKKMRIPVRQTALGDAASHSPAAVQLHPVPSKQALVIKVVTPRAPASPLEHVPCDIVLVIDVSTSMDNDAPVPGDAERTGLSVMDLTKHAALTIVETLHEKDRLGIVTFGTRSTIVQSLTCMDSDNKGAVRVKINNLHPNGSTNLWHGIQNGIRVFDESLDCGNVRAMMILTDGMPNHMSKIRTRCPQQGYIPKLKTMRPLPATLHTFGFGYGLRSGLLKSLAEFGHGNYAFIPDAGMIGTVFVHAVANLQATFATNASLSLDYSSLIEIQEVGETTVVKQLPRKTCVESVNRMTLEIQLGNLQFGQTRDLFLRCKTSQAETRSAASITAAETSLTTIVSTLSYRMCKLDGEQVLGRPLRTSTQGSILRATNKMSDAEVAYHESRAEICQFLSSMFPLGPDGEHRADLSKRETYYEKTLAELTAKLPAKDFRDAKNVSLMQDLNGPEPWGQISMAINKAAYFRKWGIHYLPSYINAHSRQICNSFKDPGPLQYGVDSPLFISCRDRLNDAFDNLPPPEPRNGPSSHARTCYAPVNMRRYRDAAGVCFAGSTPVELASGRMVPIRLLRRGTKVRTPTGMRKVAVVLRTFVRGENLCRVGQGVGSGVGPGVGSMLVTPWHPISLDGGKTWKFPALVAHGAVRYTGCVYSVMLQRDGNARSHAVRVAGAWGVTLGHGITTGNDARAHRFLGDYDRVGKSLAQLGADNLGVVQAGGVTRDASGLVSGFMYT
ncbi:hypothetical protein E4U21_006321 [Claviceps maximensis]|nr:hypothetical protein E4U21_006321 [Claviceps maximensis]